jgi:adenosylcobinamide-GDP ribazoletransferase
MIEELKIFFTAVQYYTRIPCPRWVGHSPEQLSESRRYFPLIGWIVGGAAAGVFYLAQFIFPVSISILLSMAAGILLTGAFHEDGFADTCDGFGGGWTKEEVLTIMMDSRIGTYGTIGLIFILSLKFLLLSDMNSAAIPIVLWAAHSASRFAVMIFQYTYTYARDSSDSKAKPMAQKITFRDLCIAACFGLLPMLFLDRGYGLLLFIPILVTTCLMARYCHRRIGGYTGDCLGATQQLCEIVFYFGSIALWKFI